MKRIAACLLGLALIAPGLSSAQSGVTPNSANTFSSSMSFFVLGTVRAGS